MRLNIDRDLVKQLVSGQLPNKSRHLDELTHEPSIWQCDTGQWLSCFDSCRLTILWMSRFTKTRLRHPSLPFDGLPYPTRTICRRVRTYVRYTAVKRLSMREEMREDSYVPFGKATHIWLRSVEGKNREIFFVFQESSLAINRKNKRKV